MKSQPPNPRIATMPLSLPRERRDELQALIAAHTISKGTARALFKRSRSPHPRGVPELDPRAVAVASHSITLLNSAVLNFAVGHRLKGFNPAMDRVFLISCANQWAIEIWFKPRATKKTPKRKPQERIHNDAAIFVTDKNGYRVLNGGLPSLGKRR